MPSSLCVQPSSSYHNPNTVPISFLFKNLDYTECGLFFLFTSKHYLPHNTHQDHQHKPGFLPINWSEKRVTEVAGKNFSLTHSTLDDMLTPIAEVRSFAIYRTRTENRALQGSQRKTASHSQSWDMPRGGDLESLSRKVVHPIKGTTNTKNC